MRKIFYIISCIAGLSSCEKVWVEDLQEKAYDTIRGEYEIESATWEGPDPIDLNGDGVASFDYLKEWDAIISGSPAWSSIGNTKGRLGIPYTVDDHADWGGMADVNIARRTQEYRFEIKAVIENGESHLEFILPDDIEAEFEHSGYGKIALRVNVTCTVKTGEYESKDITGPVLIRYYRSEYRISN